MERLPIFINAKSETAKIRDIISQYINGVGLDTGCGCDKVTPKAIGIDNLDYTHVNIKTFVIDLHWFTNESMDYVYSSHFLEHTKNPNEILLEMCRVLCNNGYLILYLPDRDLYTVPNSDHLHMFKSSDIINMLPKNFKIEKIIENHDWSFLIIAKKEK